VQPTEALEKTMQEKKRPLVDTSQLFRSGVHRNLYSWVQPWLEKALNIERLNELYQHTGGQNLDAGTFSEQILEELGVRYEINEAELKPLRKIEGPLIMYCNHPFGGIEALFLVMLMSHIRSDFRIMANFMLQQIEEMRGNLILVDPFGQDDSKQRNIRPLKEALLYLRQGGFLGIFPSGEVAAFKLRKGKIDEPAWNPNIAKLIMHTQPTVVPLYFHGRNSMIFQMAGILHPRLRTTLLVREFTKPREKHLRYQIGTPIPPEKIQRYDTTERLMSYLQSKLFLLGMRYSSQRGGLLLGFKKKREAESKHNRLGLPPAKSELNEDLKQLREHALLYSQSNFEVFCFNADRAPHFIKELGRLREATFREVGEGTGRSLDLSEYDMYYDQLVIWDRDQEQIVGGYRLAPVDKIREEFGEQGLYLYESFRMRPEFFERLHPAIELSRAFVAPDYQRSYFSLMLLWIGIGQYLVRHPEYRYLLGCLSISSEYREASRNFLVTYLEENYLNEALAEFVKPQNYFPRNQKLIKKYYRAMDVKDLNDVQDLIAQVQDDNLKVPVLLRQYLRIGSEVLGFNIDPNFGNALDVLMYTDLTKSPVLQMQKYLGKAGYERYRKEQGMPPLEEVEAANGQGA
jgi:putative hemolysin